MRATAFLIACQGDPDGVSATEKVRVRPMGMCWVGASGAVFDPSTAYYTSVDDCQDSGGAVLGPLDLGGSALGREGVTVGGSPHCDMPSYPQQDPAVGSTAQADAQASGIQNNGYEKDVYDCKHFARDLWYYLDDLEYDATITLVGFWYGPVWLGGHAMNDVHGEGGTEWIEPQTGRAHVLDQDGDGVVVTGPVLEGPTEGNLSIEVFHSPDEITAAYGDDFF